MPRRDGTKLAAVVGSGAGWGGIWRSSDSGATWKNMFLSDGSMNWSGIASSADGTRLAAYYHRGMVYIGAPVGWFFYGGNIYISSDSGTSWQQTGPALLGSWPISTRNLYWSSIAMSHDGSKIVALAPSPRVNKGELWKYAMSDSGLFVSTDYGATFKKKKGMIVTDKGGSVVMSPNGSIVFATDPAQDRQGYPKLWRSFDSGETWSYFPITWNSEGSNLANIAMSADGGTLVAMGHKLYSTTNYGATWTAHPDANAGALMFQDVWISNDGAFISAVCGDSNGHGSLYTGKLLTLPSPPPFPPLNPPSPPSDYPPPFSPPSLPRPLSPSPFPPSPPSPTPPTPRPPSPHPPVPPLPPPLPPSPYSPNPKPPLPPPRPYLPNGFLFSQPSALDMAWSSVTVGDDGAYSFIAAISTPGIFISSDGGASFTQSTAPPGPWYGIASSRCGSIGLKVIMFFVPIS